MVLYHEGAFIKNPFGEMPEDHIFVEETGLDPDETMMNLEILKEWGLVERTPTDHKNYITVPGPKDPQNTANSLTQEGFSVAHDRELSKKQNVTNKMLVIVTIGLFSAALIQALAGVYSVPAQYMGEMIIGTGIIGLIVVALGLHSLTSGLLIKV